jgi:dinuclear metal center YbgI/SA1388 family protein
MQLTKLIEIIETYAPPGLAMDWDRCGIQVAGTRNEIERLALALDPDEGTIQKAIDLQADFLLTHHPLALKPRLPDKPDSFYRIIKNLLTTDTILYSAHTSLDLNPQGPVSWLSGMLGLKDTSVLDPVAVIESSKPGFQAEAGLGFTGFLPSPVSFDEFSRNLKNILGIEKIIQSGDAPGMVSIVSCCPGSGGDLALKAFKAGADVFITGDLKYHQAQESCRHGCVLDVGHFILEEKMMFEWSLILKDELEDIEVYFIEGRSPFKIC